MTKKTATHANKAYMVAMQDLRRSNAATPIPLPKHKGHRGAKKRAAIAAQMATD